MRIQELLAQQMRAHLLEPSGFNVGNATAKQARGLNQFRDHGPAAWFFRQVRAWMTVKLNAACAQVNVFIVQLAAHIAQQTGQHRQVNLLIGGRLLVQCPAMFGNRRVQLGMCISPFTNSANIHKVLTQELLILPVTQLVLSACSRLTATCFGQPLPQFQIAREFTLLVVKLHMRLIGLCLRLHGSVANILHRQGTCNDQHFVQSLTVTRFQDHAANAWV